MIIIPGNYSDIGISKGEKFLVNSLKNKYDKDNIVLLNVFPVNKTRKVIFIINGQAIICSEIALNDKNILSILVSTNIMNLNKELRIIESKLLNYRAFNNNSKINVSLKGKHYYSELNRLDVMELPIYKENKQYFDTDCIFKDDVVKGKLHGIEDNKLYAEDRHYKEKIIGDRLDTFIHIVAPEYTIPVYNARDNYEESNSNVGSVVKEENKYYLKENSLSIKVLKLDQEQINIINQIKHGNQLILACAGSGKSVLLLSKCFKIASMHPDKKFLLTCYNKNLNDLYKWRAKLAGFRERNVECLTFHKLCMSLLDDINVNYRNESIDDIVYLTKKYLNEGKIKKRFFGIFIDEVQIFKPEWYELCYHLLESIDDDKHFFTICGDKSQNVSKNVKAGKATWQGGKNMPSYRGKSIRIERNYRNSIQINEFINRFTEIAKNKIKSLDIDINEDTDYILRGKAFREGQEVQVICDDKKNETNNIIKIVEKLNKEDGIDFTDIAILFHHTKFTKGTKSVYPIFYAVEKELEKRNISYSKISTDHYTERTSYGHREGVTLSTIESALGLDFKAVIICGLGYMGEYNKSNKLDNVLNLGEECIADYIANINSLYTGCTRARDYLYVITDKKNIYSEILVGASEVKDKC